MPLYRAASVVGKFSTAGKMISAKSLPDETPAESPADRDILIDQIINLRKIVSELNEQREGDRRSILILQSQIDSMRDAKCSDSLENSFKTVGAIASVLWNQLPAFPLRDILLDLRRMSKRKKKSKTSSSKKGSSSKSLNSSSVSLGQETTLFQVKRSVPRDM